MLEIIRQFLWDPTAFSRYMRSAILFAASVWQSYQITGEISRDAIIGAVIMGLAGMIGAGEKNPKAPSG